MAELELQSLRCGYQVPLCNLSLHLQTGEHVLFYGPNGVGKSTLLKTLAGLLPPLGGAVTFDGESLHRRRMLRQRVFYLPETIQVPDFLTPLEYVGLVAEFYREKTDPMRLQEGIRLLDIGGYQERPLGQCSQGQQRRSQLLAAYVLQKPLILCDDPLIGIDRNRDSILRDFIRLLAKESIVVLTGREPIDGVRCRPLHEETGQVSE